MEISQPTGEPPEALTLVPNRDEAADVAIERVWREQGSRMYRSLAAFTGDADLASEVMAEAFAQALARGDAIRQPERWVWRAAFLLAKGELQRRGRSRTAALPEPQVDAMPEPVADIVAAIRTLSPNQRQAVLLMLYADLPARDAGRIMGCSASTVRAHLTLARRRLRPLLEVHDG